MLWRFFPLGEPRAFLFDLPFRFAHFLRPFRTKGLLSAQLSLLDVLREWSALELVPLLLEVLKKLSCCEFSMFSLS